MLDYLRGKVDWSAHSLGKELAGIMDDLAHSQVTNFDLALFCDENVLKFDIPMDDAHLVKVLDSTCERCKNFPEFLLRKRFFFVPSIPDSLVRKGFTFAKSPLDAYSITM